MFKFEKSALIVGGILTALFAAGICLSYVSVSKEPAFSRSNVSKQATSRYYYPPMKIDLPPIDEPALHFADEAAIDDEAIVIGIVVGGEARAYLRKAFENSPSRHVVTDEIESTPVAITHCDRIGCTRVLTSSQPEDPWKLRVGGWRDDQTMELIVNGREFSQKSDKIPLADVPFLELPWGMWRELFPDTLVYVGASAG